jgi:hypothetical protein
MTYKLSHKLQGTTPERAARFITIINAIEQAPMSIIEISNCIGMTKSGGRRYVNDLRNEEVIVQTGFAFGKYGNLLISRPMYSINMNSEYVKQFIEALNAPTADGTPRRRGTKRAEKRDVDVYKVQKATWKLPVHTPLMAYFFGMAVV